MRMKKAFCCPAVSHDVPSEEGCRVCRSPIIWIDLQFDLPVKPLQVVVGFHCAAGANSARYAAQSSETVALLHLRVKTLPVSTIEPVGSPRSMSHSGYQTGGLVAIQPWPNHA